MLVEKIEVYRCQFCDPVSACGFDGVCYDESSDECHHPLLLEDARRMAASWNYCAKMSLEDLENKKGG